MKWKLLFIVFFKICTSFGQNVPSEMKGLLLNTNLNGGNQFDLLLNNNFNSNSDYNSFLFNEWKQGSIVLKNGDQFIVDSVNVNFDSDHFFVSIENSVIQVKPGIIEKVIVDNRSFTYCLLIGENKIVDKFEIVEEIVNNNDVHFIEYTSVDKFPASGNSPLGVKEKEGKFDFRLKKQFYLKYKDDEYQLVPKRKKRFYELFDRKKSTIIKYIKSNNLSTRDKSDLKQIILHYSKII